MAFEPAKGSGEDNFIVCLLYPAKRMYRNRGRAGPKIVVQFKEDDLFIEVNFSIHQGSGGNICQDFLVCACDKGIL